MSSEPIPRRSGAADTIAGFLAAFSIFFAAIGVFYKPLRLILPAILLALIATGIGGRNARLARIAMFTCVICWVLGMTVAVVTKHSLW
ncbi:MAG TPA: hypothetical protein VMT59_05360 [Gaiellaceae bacterium]|nr:hypothetical protein [Gaiellaceae bacterium]